MSDPFDPIENWLGSDVELMPPPAGQFERVHRRARRRKAAVAAMTAAGAAVVIAAAVTVPQLAASFLPDHGGGPDQVRRPTVSSGTPKPSPKRSVTTHPAPHRSKGPKSSSTPAGSGGLSILSSSAAPAARFEPTSITFVNDAVGAVLGQTTAGCQAGLCSTMAGTSDYGQTWTKVDAPPA